MGIKKELKNSAFFYKIYYFLRFILPNYVFGSKCWATFCIKREFLKKQGYSLDLDNPKTLNEKLQWLKLNNRNELLTICADKYRVRDWLAKQFGDEYLIPLVFKTEDWRDIKFENLPDYPCVVKGNAGNADYFIIRDKSKVDWQDLCAQCNRWLNTNYYYASHEWQYKNIKRCILVEKLLLTKEGKIPNDYKLTFFNGELQFIYCSIDREGINKRNIYDSNWKPVPFSWVASNKSLENLKGPEIEPPETLDKMIAIGKIIAKNFPYVRTDFYDVDGKLYYGEVTLCHGSGFDRIHPQSFDLELGKKLNLK